MKTLISKIIVAVIIGIIWVIGIYFDLIRQYIPGFYCEGYGCLGLGLAYLLYIPIVSFLIIGFLTFLTNKDNKVKHVFMSLGIMLLVLIIASSLTTALNGMRIEKAVTESKKTDDIFRKQIENENREIVRQYDQQGVEGYIQEKYNNDIYKQRILFQLVQQLESIATVEDIKNIDRQEYSRTINCMINNQANELGVLELFVFDTKEKKEKYEQFNTAREGHSVGWDFLDDVNCDF